jgi:hypothetical protein
MNEHSNTAGKRIGRIELDWEACGGRRISLEGMKQAEEEIVTGTYRQRCCQHRWFVGTEKVGLCQQCDRKVVSPLA